MTRKMFFLLIFLFLTPIQLFGAELKLATLEWEPYIYSHSDQGYVAQLVKMAFANSDYEVKLSFFPWARAVHVARNGTFAGYFPEYYSKKRAEEFHFSESFPAAPLVLFKRKKDVIEYSNLRDLEPYTIAVVIGYPRTFSHIGISVPDVEKAVEFYSKVMGWYTIMEPTVIHEESDTAIGKMCIDVFGTGWGSFKIAHMSTGDKIGIEMFEFKNNEKPKNFEYWKTSTFHFSVQDPDIEGLVEKIIAHGGKQRMPIREYYPGEKPFKMVYVEDPFGLIFEIYTHSYELVYSQGAY